MLAGLLLLGNCGSALEKGGVDRDSAGHRDASGALRVCGSTSGAPPQTPGRRGAVHSSSALALPTVSQSGVPLRAVQTSVCG